MAPRHRSSFDSFPSGESSRRSNTPRRNEDASRPQASAAVPIRALRMAIRVRASAPHRFPAIQLKLNMRAFAQRRSAEKSLVA